MAAAHTYPQFFSPYTFLRNFCFALEIYGDEIYSEFYHSDQKAIEQIVAALIPTHSAEEQDFYFRQLIEYKQIGIIALCLDAVAAWMGTSLERFKLLQPLIVENKALFDCHVQLQINAMTILQQQTPQLFQQLLESAHREATAEEIRRNPALQYVGIFYLPIPSLTMLCAEKEVTKELN